MMAYVVISVLFKIAYATEQIDASFTLLQLPNLQQLFYIARVLSLSAVWCLNVKKKKKRKPKPTKPKSHSAYPQVLWIYMCITYMHVFKDAGWCFAKDLCDWWQKDSPSFWVFCLNSVFLVWGFFFLISSLGNFLWHGSLDLFVFVFT